MTGRATLIGTSVVGLRMWVVLLFGIAMLGVVQPVSADGGVTFVDVADGGANGLVYTRTPSPRKAIFDALKARGFLMLQEVPLVPQKPQGAPGVALFDFDNDGDEDIYVSNGPGTANSLFSNQTMEGGGLTFIDVAAASGVAAIDQDSQGVCFGDIDNDGDTDLFVLGNGGPNALFENQGDGTFLDITDLSGTGGGDRTSTSCSLGDVNGDGLLDIAVANSYSDWSNQFPYFVEPLALNEPNQLLHNTGGNVFTDVSDSSGFTSLAGLPPGVALITWAITLVDYDQDGDVDILTSDDQTVLPPADLGGVDLGFNRLFQNDGTGQFTDITPNVGLDRFGAWMGLSVGDFNCDGSLDFFASNFGDYAPTALGLSPPVPGLWASRWFLGQGDGTFLDPGVGSLVTTPFGWGTSAFDYDNDGDTDVVFHGGFELPVLVDASNPGVILQNPGCSGQFTVDTGALTAAHTRRGVQGVAVGDVNHDGFTDIVTVSNFDAPAPIPLLPYGIPYGSVFDDLAFLVPTFAPTADPATLAWTGIEFPGGSLTVEINSADNGNNWVQVELLGSAGLTEGGQANRDGIGAVVAFAPPPGTSRLVQPVLGEENSTMPSVLPLRPASSAPEACNRKVV